MKDENYYVVHGWMINKLKLKSVKKDLYAVIFGFSQDGETEFKGSINYLCELLCCSRPTIMDALKELVDSGYILKREEVINNVKFNRYKISLPVVKNLYGGGKEILQGGGKNSLHNNTNIYNTNDRVSLIIDNKEKTIDLNGYENFTPIEICDKLGNCFAETIYNNKHLEIYLTIDKIIKAFAIGLFMDIPCLFGIDRLNKVDFKKKIEYLDSDKFSKIVKIVSNTDPTGDNPYYWILGILNNLTKD